MADTPLVYGSYSSKMHPIIPDGETDVTHNTMGKDRISPDKIFKKLIKVLNQAISRNTISLASLTIEESLEVSGDISGCIFF